MEDELQWKTTSKYYNLNISATTDQIFLKFKALAQEAKPKAKNNELKLSPVEDDLKILKIDYLSNHWSDLPQILSLSSED